jgi:DNA-binding SARP family transcriptional activator
MHLGGARRSRSLSSLHLRILGGLSVTDGERTVELGSPKQRAVLAVLALELGQVVPAERVVELLWGEDAPKATSSLHAYISNLRRALEPDRRPRDPAQVLITQPPGYRLVLDRTQVDATMFEEQVAAGRRLLAEGDFEAAIATLDAALRLWQGPPLPELADEPFVVEVNTRLRGVLGAAYEGAAEARLGVGDHEGTVGLLGPVAAEHPFRERLQGSLALALYRSGQQAQALRIIDATRTELVESAGLDLGPELRQLESDILAQAVGLDAPKPEAAAPRPTPVRRAPEDREIVRPPGPPLVGRAVEMGMLIEALHGAADGRGTGAVVIGEPGIGKTRLVEELAAEARADGIAVCWVQCPENAAIPPYWPARQITDQLGAAGLVNQQISPRAMELDQFGLHEAITEALLGITGPALLVVDDLQWADAATLRLVEHMASRLWGGPVLVVLTVRPLLEGAEAGLVDCLAEMARSSGSLRLDLAGLSPDAVAEWLNNEADAEVPAVVAAVVYERTDGNPLFVRELSALMAADGTLTDPDEARAAHQIPSGVQLVVRRRVARAPAETQQLLPVAAVLGRRFDVEVLAAVTELPLPTVLDRLVPAVDAGIISATDEPASFRFSHALVADALSAEVNALRAASLHAATAQALADRAVDDQTQALVAHHAVLGMAAGTAELAYDASVRAANHATTQYAHLDAVRHWSDAVDALERLRPGDRAARADALLELAMACQRADLLSQAETAILAAVELAEAADDVDAMGRAAARLNNTLSLWPERAYREIHPAVIAALERVLARLADHEGPVRAMVMGSLATELAYADERARGIELAGRAVDEARASGDPNALVRCLLNAYRSSFVGDSLAVRRDLIEEAVAVVETMDGAHGLGVISWFAKAVVELQSADVEACEAALRRADEHARFTSHVAPRSQLGFFRTLLAQVHARHDVVRREAADAYDLYRRGRQWQADAIMLGVELSLRHDLGGANELTDLLESVLGSPYDLLAREFGAMVLLDNGWPDDATRLLGPRGSVPEPRDDYTAPLIFVSAAHVRVEVGDVWAAEALLPKIQPFAGQVIANSSATPFVGMADLAIARVEELLGHEDLAREAYAAAVAGHERLGAPAWLARSLFHQSQLLRRSPHEADAYAAEAARQRAASIADAFDLAPLARRIAGAADASRVPAIPAD